MKRIILVCLSLISFANCFSQVKEFFPKDFKRADVPGYYKNYGMKVPIFQKSEINSSNNFVLPSADSKALYKTKSFLQSEEYIVGYTFYDLQTNNSINNCMVSNPDGTISMTWAFSRNGIPSTGRSSGYNYFDGTAWTFPLLDTLTTFASNIVVIPAGHEMIIAQTPVISITGAITDSTKIAVSWRPNKGAGPWDSLMFPWGNHVFHSLPKACGGVTNENVYVIFQGSGGPSISMTPPFTIDGQNGPLYFSKSINGGITWSQATILTDIDATHYRGFNGDSYSIDARGDTVAISFGDAFTDVGLLKSTDAGATWTKKIIQLHPQPFYDPLTDSLTDINHDGIADTISSNGSDSKVLIDNDGMCHVWFSAFNYLNDVVGDSAYTAFYGTDNLYYWNENMSQNNGYVAIASAQDFNGNGFIDFPKDTFTSCSIILPWGQYGGGLTQMPSAGIDELGRIYISYQTIDESSDTTFYHKVHRHIYMKTLPKPYNPADWTYPLGIVPNIAMGGDGENQEGVFAFTSRRVAFGFANVIYQRDGAPGHGLAAIGSCDKALNYGNSSDIIFWGQDVRDLYNPTSGIEETNSDYFFVGQNVPNPSTSSTEISVRINKAMDLKLELCDLTGRIIYFDNRKAADAGIEIFRIETSKFSKGLYTYSVKANGMMVTKKLLIE